MKHLVAGYQPVVPDICPISVEQNLWYNWKVVVSSHICDVSHEASHSACSQGSFWVYLGISGDYFSPQAAHSRFQQY